MAKIAEHHTISQKTIDDLRAEERDWEANEVAQFLRKQAERKEIFFTLGDFPVKRAYTAADLASTPIEDIGLPGRYPFTAVPIRPCIARGRGRCGRSPASAPRGYQQALQVPHRQGQTGISPISICRR